MPTLKITNLRQFEARLSGGVENLSKATFKLVKKEAEKFLSGLPDNVAASTEYQRLSRDSELRGKLGLAIASRKSGGDTDAEHLITLLRKFKKRTKLSRASRQFRITFPSLDELEEKLVHTFSSIDKGVVRSGPKASWFRWWEFGDRGEINSLIILRRTISKLIVKKTGSQKQQKSRSQLLDIISQRSRSNQAIQLEGRRPDENSSIVATGLIQKTYANFSRVFPARMGKVLRRLILQNGGRAERFFARGVIR